MKRAVGAVVGLGAAVLATVNCSDDGATAGSSGAGGATAASSTQASSSSASSASSSQSASNSSSQSATTAAVATVAVSGGGLQYVAHCNPVSNDGCMPGYACDSSVQATFKCFEPPNDVAVCGMCDPNNGPFCQGGLTCGVSNTCAKYCCDDGDCGTGKCSKTDKDGQPRFGGQDLGLCLDAMGNAACDAPALAPSKGKCVTVL